MENYDVAVVRCKTYDVETVKPALEEALNAVNGLDFVKPGMKIIIKPNLVSFKKPDAAATSIINYIFMVYLMVSFIDVDIYIIIIVLFLNLLSFLLIKDKKFIIHTLLSLIALGGIKIIYLIHEYIVNEYMDMWMLLLLVFVMIFLFLYLTYNLLSSLKTVVIANKYIRKGGNDENKKRS